MLKIGFLTDQKAARRFAKFLEAQGYESELKSADSGVELWLLDHAAIEQARSWFAVFQANPGAAQFDVKVDPKAKAKAAEAKLKQHYRRVFRRPSGEPFTWLCLIISTLVFLLQMTQFRQLILSALLILPPGGTLSSLLTQPWRLVTPIFIHQGVLHLLFNLFWVYDFGLLIESKESRWFYLGLVLSGAIFGNLLQLFFAGPFFGGLSGVVYALFGYLWISAKINLRSGYYIGDPIIVVLIGWLILGFTGILGNVANFAHLGGLLAGFLFAYARRLRQN